MFFAVLSKEEISKLQKEMNSLKQTVGVLEKEKTTVCQTLFYIKLSVPVFRGNFCRLFLEKRIFFLKHNMSKY